MKNTTRMIACGVALALLTVFVGLANAASRDTGIEGRAFLYISYGDPVEVEPGVWIGIGDIQMPIATSFRVLTANGRREVARFTTASDGSYKVSLRPGNYLLVPEPLVMPGFPTSTVINTDPLKVSVNAKQPTLMNVFYFTEAFTTVGGQAP